MVMCKYYIIFFLTMKQWTEIFSVQMNLQFSLLFLDGVGTMEEIEVRKRNQRSFKERHN